MYIAGLENLSGLSEEDRAYLGEVILRQIRTHQHERSMDITNVELYITKQDGYIKTFKGNVVVDEEIEGSKGRLHTMRRLLAKRKEDWVYRVTFTVGGVICTRMDYATLNEIRSKKIKNCVYLLNSEDAETSIRVRDWEVKGVDKDELARMVAYTYQKKTGQLNPLVSLEKEIINTK